MLYIVCSLKRLFAVIFNSKRIFCVQKLGGICGGEFCTEHAQEVDLENHYVSYFHIKKDYNNFEVINSASLRSLVLKAAWDWLPHGQNNYLIAMSSTSRIPCLRKNRFVWVSSISCLSCLLCCSQCVAPVRQRFYFSSAERLPA